MIIVHQLLNQSFINQQRLLKHHEQRVLNQKKQLLHQKRPDHHHDQANKSLAIVSFIYYLTEQMRIIIFIDSHLIRLLIEALDLLRGKYLLFIH